MPLPRLLLAVVTAFCRQSDGNTALHYSMRFQFPAVTQLLMQYKVNDTVTNKLGLTPYEGLTMDDLDGFGEAS